MHVNSLTSAVHVKSKGPSGKVNGFAEEETRSLFTPVVPDHVKVASYPSEAHVNSSRASNVPVDGEMVTPPEVGQPADNDVLVLQMTFKNCKPFIIGVELQKCKVYE